MPATLSVRVPDDLAFLVPVRRRAAEIAVGYDEDATVGHVVTSLGIPLTEVGRLRVAGVDVAPSHRPVAGDVIEIGVAPRPQPTPTTPPRFVLDVHLGTLARRLRLLGVDVAYRNDATDDELVAQADSERRVLLSQDRGLLRRSAVRHGGYVRGRHTDEQLADVIARFAPPLQPWTRCTACNGVLMPVPKSDVLDRLEPGTRRTYDEFARCPDCGRVFWAGAHSARLRAIVDAALESTTPRAAGPRPTA